MSLQRVQEYLKKYDLDKNILEFPVSSATVREAAIALKCQEDEIAKSIALLIDKQPILIVTSGNQKIDNAKYKKKFHTKAKMIVANEVENLIGHKVGGVCPFGINSNVLVYLDISLKKYKYVYPAWGSSNSAIKLSIKQLEETANYVEWVDVCKPF